MLNPSPGICICTGVYNYSLLVCRWVLLLALLRSPLVQVEVNYRSDRYCFVWWRIYWWYYNGCNYLSILGFKLIRVIRMGPRCPRGLVAVVLSQVTPSATHATKNVYLRISVPEAGISGRDKELHPTVFCGMQLLIPAWDNGFWCQSLHAKCQSISGSLIWSSKYVMEWVKIYSKSKTSQETWNSHVWFYK